MNIWLMVTALALVLLTVLLLYGLSVAAALTEKFALLDRGRQIPALRKIIAAASAVALVCAIVVLVIAVVPANQATGPAPTPNVESRPEPESARAPKPAPAPQPAPEPEPATEPMPVPAPAPSPAKTQGPIPPASPNGATWRQARVVSSGDVTFRGWPNGTAAGTVFPGERVWTEGHTRDSGGHTWLRIRLEDGRIGWVVQRFIVE